MTRPSSPEPNTQHPVQTSDLEGPIDDPYSEMTHRSERVCNSRKIMTIDREHEFTIKLPEDEESRSAPALLHGFALECAKRGLLSDLAGLDYTQSKGRVLATPISAADARCQTITCIAFVPASTLPVKATKLALEISLRDFLHVRNLSCGKRVSVVHALKTTIVCEKGPADSQSTLSKWEREAEKEVEDFVYQNKEIVDQYRGMYPHERDRRMGFIRLAIDFSGFPISVAQTFLQTIDLSENMMRLTKLEIVLDANCGFCKKRVLETLSDPRLSPRYKANGSGRSQWLSATRADRPNSKIEVWNDFARCMEDICNERPVGIDIQSGFEEIDGRGMMRIKVTRSVDDPKQVDVHSMCTDAMAFLDLLGKKAQLFEHPIVSQWQQITSQIHASLAVVDVDTKDYVVAFWCNSKTKKVCGPGGRLTPSQSEEPEEIKTRILSRFAFRGNVPMHFLAVRAGSDGLARLFMSTHCLVDAAMGMTNVPGRSHWDGLTNTSVGSDPISPEERGLVDVSVCGLLVPTTHQRFQGMSPINYVPVPFAYPKLSTWRTGLPLAPLELSVIGGKYWNLTNRKTLVDGKTCTYGNLKDIPDGGAVQVFACRRLTSDGSSHVLMTDNSKLYRSSAEVSDYIEKMCKHFKAYNNVYFWGPEICPLFSFVKVRRYSSAMTNTICVETSNIRLDPRLALGPDGVMAYNEEVDVKEGVTWTSSVPCIGELPMGEHVVTAIRPKSYRSKGNNAMRYCAIISGRIHKSSFMFEDKLNGPAPDGDGTCYDWIIRKGRPFRIRVSGVRRTYRKKMQNELTIDHEDPPWVSKISFCRPFHGAPSGDQENVALLFMADSRSKIYQEEAHSIRTPPAPDFDSIRTPRAPDFDSFCSDPNILGSLGFWVRGLSCLTERPKMADQQAIGGVLLIPLTYYDLVISSYAVQVYLRIETLLGLALSSRAQPSEVLLRRSKRSSYPSPKSPRLLAVPAAVFWPYPPPP
ncbi:hypothetical protein BDK51DRAFT_28694 [Blyttiomyces helicus]|uniref:Uncharacterized protein n=1 Tax=Blyttiomyces helicus TaxID=388810 RepID=A0A4P9WEK5_9FUNG|nr:hypothetical protein BDK51DRAFT_28694 [Blyttiomyces helicus]|eukprot:RKO90143.1 hypothetical protein BDK51DRAFT_28694 [Blyttiomyces helicus]